MLPLWTELEENLTIALTVPVRRQKKSLHNCLVVLGAAIEDVYAYPKGLGGRGGWKRGTIFDKYDLYELNEWVDDLFVVRLKQVHPDKTGGNTERMAEANVARDTAKRLLSRRREERY